LSEAEEKEFVSDLADDFECATKAIAKIDTRKSKAWKKEDEDNIKRRVQQTLGFEQVNVMVMNQFREWLGRTGRGALERMKEGGDWLGFQNNLANLLQGQGKLDEAERMYHECLKLMREKLGKDHPHTCLSLLNLALVLHTQGRDPSSLVQEMFDSKHAGRILEMAQTQFVNCKMKGPSHSDTVFVAQLREQLSARK